MTGRDEEPGDEGTDAGPDSGPDSGPHFGPGRADPPADPRPEPRPDPQPEPADPDAAWRAIVENYGERATVDDDPADPVEPVDPFPSLAPLRRARERREHDERQAREHRGEGDDRGGSDALNTGATWADEGHFVPPPPPPLPRPEPRRRLAWLGLFGGPLVMLVCVVLGWTLPGWVSALLLAGFVGGFGYLVATMRREGPWDDGAVL